MSGRIFPLQIVVSELSESLRMNIDASGLGGIITNDGKIFDVGVEVGASLGQIILKMDEKEIEEFVLGLRKGLSIFNE